MRVVVLALLLVTLSACQTLAPEFEQPSITVTSISMLPTEGVEAKFNVGVRIENPNKVALNIVDLSYDLTLEGHKLEPGAGKELPAIPANGSSEFKLTASTNMLQNFKFVTDLLNTPRDRLVYQFGARVDLDSTQLPALQLSDRGEIAFTSPNERATVQNLED